MLTRSTQAEHLFISFSAMLFCQCTPISFILMSESNRNVGELALHIQFFVGLFFQPIKAI